jgi:hypothetical protein
LKMALASGNRYVVSTTVRTHAAQLMAPVVQEAIDDFDVRSDPDVLALISTLEERNVLQHGAGKALNRGVCSSNYIRIIPAHLAPA